MSSNNQFVIFQRSLARNVLIVTARLFKYLSHTFVGFLTSFLFTISYPLIIRQRRIAEESIEIAFGDTLMPQEKKHIVRKCFRNFSFGMMEMLFFMAHPKLISKYVSIAGQYYIDKALKR